MRAAAARRWAEGAGRLARSFAVVAFVAAGLGAAGLGACSDSRAKGPSYPSDAGTAEAGEASDGGEHNHARTPKRPPSQRSKAPKKGAVKAKKDEVAREVGAVQKGFAVWYGGELHGSPTASGERFDKNAMTAAHRTLPLGTTVKVTNQDNGVSVTVRINDRGPFGKRKERIIDVSEAAAKILDFIGDGDCPVTLEVLTLPASRKDKAR